jgi:Lrp/AsnC family transcriptional regulator, regulator for asnA, asnC and gidA
MSELAKDPRQNNIQLARKLGVSEKTVRRRIADLVERRIISWALIPDFKKLGYAVRVYIGLEVEMPHIDKITQSLANHTNVDFIALCTGSFDILFGAWFESSESMAEFVKNYLSQIGGIRKSFTHVALEVSEGKMASMTFLQREFNEVPEAGKKGIAAKK